MNLKLFLSTFFLIFLAELGDKTQLSVVGRSADPGAKWTVFAAASLALIVSTFVAVQLGALLTRWVDPRYIKLGAGLLFLIMGGLLLAEGLRARAAEPRAAVDARPVGALGRFVLAQAVAFERAAFDDYRQLAAQATHPRVRQLLQELAIEEELHAEEVAGLHDAHAAAELPREAVDALPQSAALLHDVAADDAPVLAHAIEHELATAAFYSQLSRITPLPALRHAFTALAAAEQRHVDRLRELAKELA